VRSSSTALSRGPTFLSDFFSFSSAFCAPASSVTACVRRIGSRICIRGRKRAFPWFGLTVCARRDTADGIEAVGVGYPCVQFLALILAFPFRLTNLAVPAVSRDSASCALGPYRGGCPPFPERGAGAEKEGCFVVRAGLTGPFIVLFAQGRDAPRPYGA